jgi:hypothetical protein
VIRRPLPNLQAALIIPTQETKRRKYVKRDLEILLQKGVSASLSLSLSLSLLLYIYIEREREREGDR